MRQVLPSSDIADRLDGGMARIQSSLGCDKASYLLAVSPAGSVKPQARVLAVKGRRVDHDSNNTRSVIPTDGQGLAEEKQGSHCYPAPILCSPPTRIHSDQLLPVPTTVADSPTSDCHSYPDSGTRRCNLRTSDRNSLGVYARHRGFAFFIAQRQKHFSVLVSNFFKSWALITPTRNNPSDIHFNLPDIESFPYFDEAKKHLDSGYPRVWGSWVSLQRRVKQYNEGLAASVESALQAEVVSTMNKVFPPDTSPGFHRMTHDFWIQRLAGEITMFWRGTMDAGNAPFELKAKEGTTGIGSVVMQLNGADVYWTDNQDEVRPANEAIVRLALSVQQMYVKGGEGLVNQFFTANEAYADLVRRLGDFQSASITPINTTFLNEDYLEGKCKRCPTVWGLFRKYFT